MHDEEEQDNIPEQTEEEQVEKPKLDLGLLIFVAFASLLIVSILQPVINRNINLIQPATPGLSK